MLEFGIVLRAEAFDCFGPGLFHIVAPLLLAEPALVAGSSPIRKILVGNFSELGMAQFLEPGADAGVRNAVADQGADLVTDVFWQGAILPLPRWSACGESGVSGS